MKLLLDTHVVLWWLDDSAELNDEVKHLLDTEPSVFVSAVTPWEIAVKQSLGKLEGPADTWRNGYGTASSSRCPSPPDTAYGRVGCPGTTGIPSTGY